MIKAHDIAFSVQGKSLFDTASFRFDKPEFVAILGPNGAGKSTLLQLLAGYHRPASGKVFLHGKEAHAWKPEELAKHRAYLQQQQSVFESFSVEDVLMIGRSIHYNSFPTPLDKQLVSKALSDLELQHRREEAFNRLSGGEQQRVQFMRTLLQLQETASASLDGKALFLDEPLNNLDLYYQYCLLQLARERVVKQGGMVIAVLHDLNMAYQFADRVVLLSEGKTIVDAPTEEAMAPELLSAIYNMHIERIESPDQLPYFAVKTQPFGAHSFAQMQAAVRS